MLLIPYEHYSVELTAPIEKVHERIYHAIHSERSQPRYDGRLYRDSFTMSRSIGYRDSMLPVVRGRLKATTSGTQIDIYLLPHLLTLGVIIAGLLPFLFLTGVVLVKTFTEYSISAKVFIPLIMALVWYTIPTVWFRLEVAATQSDLHNILTGSISSPPPPSF